MKKRIIMILDVESDDAVMMNENFIEKDLSTEINCASNSYDILSINFINDAMEAEINCVPNSYDAIT